MKAFALWAALALLDCAVIASPINNIDTVWVTTTKTYYTTIDWYTTVAADSIVAFSVPAPTSIVTQAPAPAPISSVVATQAPAPASAPAPAPAPSSVQAPAPAPAPSSVQASAPVASSSALAAPAPAPAPTPAVQIGDLTWYYPGLGSCGWESTNSDAIVALSHDIMAASAGGPNCGRMITISSGGRTVTAKVVDTCEACDATSIDLSPAVFEEFASLGTGVISNAEWWFSS